jgi:hypothetical protein
MSWMRNAGAALACALLPLAASAQTSSDDDVQPPPTQQGPMIVERVHSGFLIAPEVKATRFDKQVKPLVGGSAGWVADETFFIGGGGYWMPERGRSDRELAYGGVVLQLFLMNGDRFGLSAKGLFGGGRATLPDTVTEIVVPVLTPPVGRNTPPVALPVPLPQPRTITTTIRSRQDFVVAEPEVNARIAFTRSVRLALGAGYRFAGNDWRRGFDRGPNGRVSGATASIGLQIGG